MERKAVLNKIKSPFLDMGVAVPLGVIAVVDLGGYIGLDVTYEMPQILEETKDPRQDI